MGTAPVVEIDKARDRHLRLILLLLALIFLILRLKNLNHVLLWDESQFVLTVKSFVNGSHDAYRYFIRFHPPVYLLFCAFMFKYIGVGAHSYEIISLVFSLGTFFLTYLITKHLFDERIALLSAFFLAVMPASTIMDVWIKQDSIAIFFLALSIYLFLKERYVTSGIALGLGMLSKEIAVFALMVIALCSLVSWSRKMFKGAAIVAAIGALISFWWYLWLANSVGHFRGFFQGNVPEAALFKQPWYYYIRGLPKDAGWVIVALGILGIISILFKAAKGDRAVLLPVLWLLSIYLFISFSVGKPYWMVQSALPAAAMLAAIGLAAAYAMIKNSIHSRRWVIALNGVLGIVLLLALLSGVLTGSKSYNQQKLPAYMKQSIQAKADGEFIKHNAVAGDLVYMVFGKTSDNRDPVLTYYMGDNVAYFSLQSAILESPGALAESAGKQKGGKWVYIKKSPDPIYVNNIAGFLEGLHRYADFDVVRDNSSSSTLLLHIPPASVP